MVHAHPTEARNHERMMYMPLQPSPEFGQGTRVRLSFSDPRSSPIEDEPFSLTWLPRYEPAETIDQYAAYQLVEERSYIMTATYAIAAAFTEGTRRAQSVTWWFREGQALLPGYYCPDIVTALYELEKWNTGTPGKWAICLKCGTEFKRRNADHLYCKDKCEQAAANQRCRAKNKKKRATAEAKPE